VVANLAAFSALAFAVARDADRRESAAQAVDTQVRELVTERVADIFVSWFSDLDFDLESLEGRFDLGSRHQGLQLEELLNQRYWAYAKDAYITNRPFRVGGRVLPGPIQLNPLGAPDDASELLRPRALELAEKAYREGVEQRAGAQLAIPLHSARDPEQPVGAAYVLVDVPTVPRPSAGLNLPFVTASMGGATLAAVGFVFLLMHVLVLKPLKFIGRGARRVTHGDFSKPVPGTGRRDEIDTLVHAFNNMMFEIAQSRAQLEQRVEDAVERMRATERRLVLTERLAAMGTLAAGIAHEINNPLGGMQNAVKSIESAELPAETRERYVKLVSGGLERIRQVVQRVLRFSPRTTKPGPVAIEQVIADATDFVQHRVRERNIGIDVDVDPALMVRGDAAALGQVFLNLLVNADDAIWATGRTGAEGGSAGSITIVARAEGQSARIQVTDDGVGMTVEQREQAFDLFFTTKEAGAGTGLGLSIAHQIVTEHGGTMELRSEPGRGTTVELVLPAV